MPIPSNFSAPDQPNMHEQADHVKKACSASKETHSLKTDKETRSLKTDMEKFLDQKSKSRVYKKLYDSKSRITKIFRGISHQKLP